jgi:hypothetical protein
MIATNVGPNARGFQMIVGNNLFLRRLDSMISIREFALWKGMTFFI